MIPLLGEQKVREGDRVLLHGVHQVWLCPEDLRLVREGAAGIEHRVGGRTLEAQPVHVPKITETAG